MKINKFDVHSKKEIFLKEFESNKNQIIEKYGMFIYFLIQNVINVSSLEQLVETNGCETKRRIVDKTVYSDIYNDVQRKHRSLYS
jgi:hypothetical protein